MAANPTTSAPSASAADHPHARVGLGAIAFIVRRSLRRHLLSTAVTIAATALAAALVMSVFALRDQTERAFTGGACGFDAVLGARGSRLQLVLNALFHIDNSPGNIPWTEFQSVQADPRVAAAVPIAVGDNYRGYRIAGTDDQLFTQFRPRRDEPLRIQPGGRAFNMAYREAVIGDVVAHQTGLRVGDTFHPYHGLTFDPAAEHHDEHDEFLVVGIFEPTNTPIDRVVWVPIEGIYRMSGHVLSIDGERFEPVAGEEIPEENKVVSAVLLKLKSPQFGLEFDQEINKDSTEATFAWPVARVLAELFDQIGWMSDVLRLVAVLVLLVSAAAILASLHNTIHERRREFAVFRALGARRSTVFSMIIAESATIAAIGAFGGMILYVGLMAVVRAVIRDETGVVLDLWMPHAALVWTPIATIALGAAAGLIPAAKAYQTDVATNLAPHS